MWQPNSDDPYEREGSSAQTKDETHQGALRFFSAFRFLFSGQLSLFFLSLDMHTLFVPSLFPPPAPRLSPTVP